MYNPAMLRRAFFAAMGALGLAPFLPKPPVTQKPFTIYSSILDVSVVPDAPGFVPEFWGGPALIESVGVRGVDGVFRTHTFAEPVPADRVFFGSGFVIANGHRYEL